jgi:peptide/nickel transport system permease protein
MYMAGTCIVFFTMLLLIGNLAADLLLAWVDPRIRLE